MFVHTVLELSVKVLAGMFMFKVDPNLSYAYATLEAYRYYQAYERVRLLREYMRNEGKSDENTTVL